ncbi:LysR family transcriptional regulator [Agrobacterium sp. BA1120]|uniref:LysR family transcriptional regulator n=1 Tax=Agrobacterium sp. BA1120 TaxID=3228927 RepID=UPI00336AD712
MSAIPQTTLEQWAVLRTVIDAGSFAKAASKLNRSQSSVSYAVSRLQDRLGVQLVAVTGRKAHLTEIGRTLLAEAVPLISALERLELRGKANDAVGHVRLRLLVDPVFPRSMLIDAFETIKKTYPQVEVIHYELVRGAEPIEPENYDLAIRISNAVTDFAHPLTVITTLMVACPGHPILELNAPLARDALSLYPRLQVVGHLEGQDRPTAAREPKWRVNTFDAALAAVRHGLCFGRLPIHLIEDDVKAGRLVPLELATGIKHQVRLMLVYADEQNAPPIVRVFASLLMDACRSEKQ